MFCSIVCLDVMRELLRKVNQIYTKIKGVEEQLEEIQKQICKQTDPNEEITLDVDLPLRSIDEVLQLETNLEEKLYYQKLVSFLKKYITY